jgi:hypothetical protein
MTIVIKGVLDEKVNGLQNGFAKKFKGVLERMATQFGGKLEEFQVDNGVVTVTVDQQETADKLIAELKAKGKDAAQVPDLDAFFESLDRSKKTKKAA